MSWDKVDWSQAPEDAVAWSAYRLSGSHVLGQWHTIRQSREAERVANVWIWASSCSEAPDFGYSGTAHDSLTFRPKDDAHTQENAKRYVWLRDLPDGHPAEFIGNMPGDSWDALIDQYMSEEAK